MSVAFRVALLIATLSILTAVLVTGSAIVSTSSGVRDDIDDFLEERAEEITDGTRRRPDRDRDSDEENRTNTSELDAQVQTIDSDGNIEATTGLAIPITDDTITLANSDNRGKFETTTIDGVEYRVYTSPVQGGGAIQVATSLENTTSLLGLLRTRQLILGAALASLAAAIGWLIAHRTLRPLGQLTAAAEQVALTKDLDSVIDVNNSDDEIGRLATSFNQMLEALESSRRQQHQLVQDAAHELRTPLTSVNANIDLLMHARDLPAADRQDILASVRAELRQLGTLFTEIIELATDRQQATAPAPVDLVSVVNHAVDDFSRRASNTITVDATPSMVTGDFKALLRVVSNLLGNAVKYSPTDSPIHITVSNGTVAVRDHGPGIPPEERERIFDRFHRLDQARPLPGSGLGLAIVAKTVGDHGGQTFVNDVESGNGIIVGFTIPTPGTTSANP